MKVTSLAVVVLSGIVFSSANTRATTTRTWTGTDGGDWFESANWDPDSNYPQEGDAVIINSGSVWLSAPTEHLASFTISDASMMFTNWATFLKADIVTVESGGILTLPDAFTDSQMSNRVMIVCSNFTLHADGLIDANHKGFSGSLREDGYGPGKGIKGGRGSGAGHGGAGGQADGSGGLVAAGVVYGSPDAPTQPGSGGGAFTGSSNPSSVGGPGGGAVRIEASGDVVINGTIQADGGNTTAHGGGGSGGSIYLSGHRFGGTGTLTANGGNGHNGGGGGAGGRITLDYAEIIGTPTVEKQVIEGTGVYNGWFQRNQPRPALPPVMGSLWLPDTALLSTVVSNFSGYVHIDGLTEWNRSTLSVSKNAFGFGHVVDLQISEHFSILDGGTFLMPPGSALSVSGAATLESGNLGAGPRCEYCF